MSGYRLYEAPPLRAHDVRHVGRILGIQEDGYTPPDLVMCRVAPNNPRIGMVHLTPTGGASIYSRNILLTIAEDPDGDARFIVTSIMGLRRRRPTAIFVPSSPAPNAAPLPEFNGLDLYRNRSGAQLFMTHGVRIEGTGVEFKDAESVEFAYNTLLNVVPQLDRRVV